MAEPQKTGSGMGRFAAQAHRDDFDWVGHIEAVADHILGLRNEQMSRPPDDVRFGNKGSVSINFTTGQWYDFEHERGGGVKDLIRVYANIEDRDEAIAYAKECLNGGKPHAEGDAATSRQDGSGKNQNKQQRKIEATYTYHDAEGQVAFEVVRSVFKQADGCYAIGADGKRIKSFAQRRPSGETDGGWLWGIGAGEFMRAGPGKDWITFSETKFSKYPTRTRQRKVFDTPAPVLPYRLPELLQALAANQTILIPEGEKKVERIRELGFPATCNAGGAKKWSAEHTTYLKGADVVLLPDNDQAGCEHIIAIAQSLSGVAKRVRVLDLLNLPEKGDVVDWQGSAEEFAQLVAAAEDYAPDQRDQPKDHEPDQDDQPLPLMRPLPPPEPFPIDALGPGLSDAARGIADIVQAPIEMCAGAVLGSASLAVSAHIDVELPTGEIKPASLFLIPLAESGERKTTVDGHAFAAQQRWEQKLRVNRAVELEAFRVSHATWEAKSKAIAKQYQKPGEAGSQAHQKELEQLGPEPEKPLEPLLMSAEFTFEGLVRCLNIGQPIYGIIGSEGGQFVGGHGMTDESKQRTLSNINEVWDGRPIKRVRADETITLPGRRVSMHLGMQPVVAQQLLTDELATKLGFLGRILICWPESLIGTRLHKEPPPQAKQNVADFTTRVLAILEAPYPLVEDTRNELAPRPLPFSAEATKLYWEFADETEKAMAADGEYESIRPFAAKLPEHAARIAATIAGYQDIHVSELGRDDFVRGILIASYYAGEAKRIMESSLADPDLMMAQKLLTWLSTEWKDKPTIQAREIYQFGPNAIRNRKAALAAAETLVVHGWLKPKATKRANQKEWQILFFQEQ
jgi:hypothetical protein